jgi:FKBP-type peptidyl-prolyl cis-trans isomerase
MPSTPAGQRLLGHSIALLAVTALLAYGCEQAKKQDTKSAAPSAPAQPAAKPDAGKPAADAPKATPPTATPAADATKPDASATDADGKPKPKPIPHTDIAKDAKPLTEYNHPSGTIVQEFKVGQGERVMPKAKVTVHFVMYMQDGWKKLESTYDRGEPLTALVDEFVWGMGDGLIGMQPGGVRRMIVPPSRGYGDKGKPGINGGPDIPPGATLVFDVELVSIQQTLMKDAPSAPTAAPVFKQGPVKPSEPDVNK